MGIEPSKPDTVLVCGETGLIAFDMGDAAKHFKVPRNTIAQRNRRRDTNQRVLLEPVDA
jgi:DNA (cytosine-5)-methyltransferase 1